MYEQYLRSLLGSNKIKNNKVNENENDKSDSDHNNGIENKNENENENEISDDDFCLLSDGALIMVDNTLWKGLVLGQVNEQHCTYDGI